MAGYSVVACTGQHRIFRSFHHSEIKQSCRASGNISDHSEIVMQLVLDVFVFVWLNPITHF